MLTEEKQDAHLESSPSRWGISIQSFHALFFSAAKLQIISIYKPSFFIIFIIFIYKNNKGAESK
jgi:hypothetical protein